MAYSTAYQDVTAGRVREDEAITFFGKNKVAASSRTFNLVGMGGKKQPTIEKNHLQHEGVGKPGTESKVLDVYIAPADQIG